MSLLHLLILIVSFLSYADINRYLERGNIEKVIVEALRDREKKEALFVLKALADTLVNEEIPGYIKRYVKGALAEKEGDIKKPLTIM